MRSISIYSTWSQGRIWRIIVITYSFLIARRYPLPNVVMRLFFWSCRKMVPGRFCVILLRVNIQTWRSFWLISMMGRNYGQIYHILHRRAPKIRNLRARYPGLLSTGSIKGKAWSKWSRTHQNRLWGCFMSPKKWPRPLPIITFMIKIRTHLSQEQASVWKTTTTKTLTYLHPKYKASIPNNKPTMPNFCNSKTAISTPSRWN